MPTSPVPQHPPNTSVNIIFTQNRAILIVDTKSNGKVKRIKFSMDHELARSVGQALANPPAAPIFSDDAFDVDGDDIADPDEEIAQMMRDLLTTEHIKPVLGDTLIFDCVDLHRNWQN